MGGFKINFEADGRACSKCGVFKAWDNFSKLPSRKTVISTCKQCACVRARIWREQQKAAGIKRSRKEYAREYDRRKAEKLAGRPRPDICEICHKPDPKKPMHFDHDHATGLFRGWICSRCNLSLGLVKDSVPILQSMAEYLSPTPEYGLSGC